MSSIKEEHGGKALVLLSTYNPDADAQESKPFTAEITF